MNRPQFKNVHVWDYLRRKLRLVAETYTVAREKIGQLLRNNANPAKDLFISVSPNDRYLPTD